MLIGGTVMQYVIDLLWDNEAKVWVATSEDVPGLVLESGSFDALIERVQNAVPELLELNSLPKGSKICYNTQKFWRVYA